MKLQNVLIVLVFLVALLAPGSISGQQGQPACYSLTQNGVSYKKLNSGEKKKLVLDIIKNSPLGQKIRRINYTYPDIVMSESKNPLDKLIPKPTRIMISVPESMTGKSVDIFLVQLEPGGKEAEITFANRKVAATEYLSLKFKENKQHFFVFVEPTEPLCGYNRIQEL